MKALHLLLLGTLSFGGAWAVFAAPGQTPKPTQSPPALRVTPDAAEFFEKHVRPVLAENCFACHGQKVQMAGLRLDSRAGMLKKSQAGRIALTPGDPEKSALVRVLRYEGAVKMPPKGKLSDKDIQSLTEWVKMGAPWPQYPGKREEGRGKNGSQASAHWAFQPVRKPTLPKTKNQKPETRNQNPIDAFILAKLEAKGLTFAPPADKRTLIRRVTYDLTGLPPTLEEIEAFLKDTSAQAYQKVVDRLLASPHYGERWGRHWLDVARYADTKGYVYTEERRYPFSYTYRDWVIRALNEDMGYDQFLLQQLAADCLPGNDKRNLAATGFLTLGRRFVNNPPDVIDDRIDVVMRGTQALTVSCARCHDHKFDPIPTKDYYSLYGVFAGSTERTVQMVDAPERTKAYEEYEKELQKREAALNAGLEAKRAELSDRLRRQVAAYLPQVPDVEKLPGNDFYIILSKEDVNPFIVRLWKVFIDATARGFHPVFAPWHAFGALSAEEFAAKAPALAQQFAANADPARRLNPMVARLFAGPPPASMREVAERYGKLLAEIDTKWREQQKTNDQRPTTNDTIENPAPDALPDPNEEVLRQTLYAPDAATTIPPVRIGEIETFFDEGTRNELNALQAKVDQWYIASSATPPHALTLADLPAPRNPRVFRRGDPRNLGEEVPRQFLAIVSGANRQPFRVGSGRLEMARAIASKDNPLTARVMVNRVWQQYFGAGLVRTPSDFGTRSEPPTHPELLDWLAATFVAKDERGMMNAESKKKNSSLILPPSSFGCNWSLKKLHRLILLSKTYRQSSEVSPAARRKDPENRLLSRMNRRRLDFEALRDSLLSVTGQLEKTMGGPSVEITSAPFSGRRSVYAFIDRQNLPGLLRTFDFANPDTHSPQRFVTTVPQQALFMLNSPFVAEGARKLASRTEVQQAQMPEARIRTLYRLVYQREPTAREMALGQRFVAQAEAQPAEPDAPEPSPWSYGYGAVDATAKRIKAFTPLAHWTGEVWQAGEKRPDPQLGSLRLTANGGEPGKTPEQAAIRRWTAPRDMVIAVTGKLKHESKEGDGVQAWIISSRTGELGQWTTHNSEADTGIAKVEVKRGDTVDFVVDGRANPEKDGFAWSPVIRVVEEQASGGVLEWSASREFAGPPASPPKPLTAWEEYAQALLLANEFVFVD